MICWEYFTQQITSWGSIFEKLVFREHHSTVKPPSPTPNSQHQNYIFTQPTFNISALKTTCTIISSQPEISHLTPPALISHHNSCHLSSAPEPQSMEFGTRSGVLQREHKGLEQVHRSARRRPFGSPTSHTPYS